MANQTPRRRRTREPVISTKCLIGQHNRCLGTVFVIDDENGGSRIVPCECKNCTHTRD